VNEQEETTIRKWHESLRGPIQLDLILTESDQNKRFNDYAAAFTQIASAVEIKKEKKDTADPSVKGDVLYLLGTIGSPEIIPLLKRLVADFDEPDLRNAFEEAVSEICSRNRVADNGEQ